MAPRSRYVVDPSLLGGPQAPQTSDYPAYPDQRGPQLHTEPQYQAPAGNYYPQPSSSQPAPQQQQQYAQTYQQAPTPSYHRSPPENHIEQPPHSAGPKLRGLRSAIDPSQMPSPLEIIEQDEALYEGEDFLSCNTKGLVPLGGTDYRGFDQGECLSHLH
jgi:protein transport protein SEC24